MGEVDGRKSGKNQLKDIDEYREWQAGNRQLNAEKSAYGRYLAYCKESGQPPHYTTLGAFRRAWRAEEQPTVYKMWRNRNSDREQYQRCKKIVGAENMPKTLAKFQKMKYNDQKQAQSLKTEHDTIQEIKTKQADNPTYAQKMIDTYYEMKSQGVLMTYHSLNRFIGQKQGKGKKNFTQDDIIAILKQPANYKQEDGRLVRFYDGIAIIQSPESGEVVTIVTMIKPKGKWEKL